MLRRPLTGYFRDPVDARTAAVRRLLERANQHRNTHVRFLLAERVHPPYGSATECATARTMSISRWR